MRTKDLQRELADASRVIAALTSKLDRANETIKGLEATIESLRQERDRERAKASRNWDALSDRIARFEEYAHGLEIIGDEMKQAALKCDATKWDAQRARRPQP
jgi:capsule polysaccharide export protein KpsE/RkpR